MTDAMSEDPANLLATAETDGAGCGFGGGPAEYLYRLGGGSGSPKGSDFVEIVRELAGLAGVPFPERQLNPEEQAAAEARAAKRAALATVYQRGQDELWSERGDEARRYLLTSGLGGDAVRDLGPGLHPALHKIRDALRTAGYDVTAEHGAWGSLKGM